MQIRVRLRHGRLAAELARSKLSQNAWATRLGVSSGYLSLMVNGKRLFPGPPLQERLLEELGLEFDELFVLQHESDSGASDRQVCRGEARVLSFHFWRWRFQLSMGLRRDQSARSWRGDTMPWKDLVHSLRLFARRPSWSLIAILTVALGVGMSSSMFAVIKHVLLDPLPYPEADRLVRIFGTLEDEKDLNVSPIDFQDWQAELESFEGLAAFSAGSLTVLGSEGADLYQGLFVSPNFFEVLRTPLQLGNTFSREEGQPGSADRVILSHALWRDRFGEDPGIIGKAIRLADGTTTVIGVARSDFRSPEIRGEAPLFWRNLVIDPDRHGRGGHWLRAIGRMKAGVQVEHAQTELESLALRLAADYPETNEGWSVRLVDLKYSEVEGTSAILWTLMAAVGLVLFIASINLASLLLSLTLTRLGEFGVRMSLGASFARVVSQLLTETLVLLGPSFLLAVAICWAVVAGVRQLGPRVVPGLDRVVVEPGIFLFALGATLAAALIGLVPALLKLRNFKPQAIPRGTGPGLGRFADFLVIAEVALTVAILIAAGLLAHSFSNLLQTSPGFQPERLLTFELQLPREGYSTADSINGFFSRVQSRLAARSDVVAAAATNRIPLGRGHSCDGFTIENHPPLRFSEGHCAESRVAQPDYFQTLQIPLLDGRYLRPSDTAAAPPVVLVNRALAEKYWPGRPAVGQRLRWGGPDEEEGVPWRTIVGVVGDVLHFGVDSEPPPEIYMPAEQFPTRQMFFAVRSVGEPRALLTDIRGYIQEQDPGLPLRDVQTMEERLRGSLAGRRFNLAASWSFALLAVVLSMAGIYGVVSFSTLQRVPEIGVRIALGAGRAQILRLVLGSGLKRAILGLGMGCLLGIWLSSFLADQLFSVSRMDPLTFVLAPVLLLVVVALAAFVPARRATRVAPMKALNP